MFLFIVILPGIGVCQVSKVVGGAVYGPGPVPPPPPFVPDGIARGSFSDIIVNSGSIFLTGGQLVFPPFFDGLFQKRSMTGLVLNSQFVSAGATSFNAVYADATDVYAVGYTGILRWMMNKRNKTTWANAYLNFYVPITGINPPTHDIVGDATAIYGFGGRWSHKILKTGVYQWSVAKVLPAGGQGYLSGGYLYTPTNTNFASADRDLGLGIGTTTVVGGHDPVAGAQIIPDVYPGYPPTRSQNPYATWLDGADLFVATNMYLMKLAVPALTTTWIILNVPGPIPAEITSDAGNIYISYAQIGLPSIIQKWTKAGGLVWTQVDPEVLNCLTIDGSLLYLAGRRNGFPDNLYIERRDATTGNPI
jgi:hypothetical protein